MLRQHASCTAPSRGARHGSAGFLSELLLPRLIERPQRSINLLDLCPYFRIWISDQLRTQPGATLDQLAPFALKVWRQCVAAEHHRLRMVSDVAAFGKLRLIRGRSDRRLRPGVRVSALRAAFRFFALLSECPPASASASISASSACSRKPTFTGPRGIGFTLGISVPGTLGSSAL